MFEEFESFFPELVKGGKVAVPGNFEVKEAPQSFNQVQVGWIWRQEVELETAVFFQPLSDQLTVVVTGVV